MPDSKYHRHVDRDKALELLRGGREGIAEWNRLREVGEELPDLSEAELNKADLSGRNDLRTTFRGTYLSGPNLPGCDLRGANLFRAHLHEANLVRVDLRGANDLTPKTVSITG